MNDYSSHHGKTVQAKANLRAARASKRNQAVVIATYCLVLLVGVLLILGVHSFTSFSLKQATRNYRLESHEEAQETAHHVNDVFRNIYQSLRTIARLPGVRNIDRYAHNFNADSRATVQEIYNNVYANVTMSELYIVPLDLEPDQLDPNTGRLQKPIFTFDEFIVGRSSSGLSIDSELTQALEEIDIYEYYMMKQQLAWFHKWYPRESDIEGLEYPAISGPTVVTSDNTAFSTSQGNENQRTGIVYSVPMYGPAGNLKGCVSGVLLLPVMQRLLPTDEYVIRHDEYDTTVEPFTNGQWSHSQQAIEELAPDANLIYSEVLPLETTEGIGQWHLWAGFANARFHRRPDVRASYKLEVVGYSIAVLMTMGMCVITWLIERHNHVMDSFVQALETSVAQRTSELERINERLVHEVNERQKAQEQLKHEALHDALTGIPNRALLMERLEQSIERSKRISGYLYAVLFLDMDDFKLVNDRLGHRTGDELLVEFARRLMTEFRSPEIASRFSNETLARLGGDEFVVLLDGMKTSYDASFVAECIKTSMNRPFHIQDDHIKVGVSIGVATSQRHYDTPDDILRDADFALYESKSLGKGQYAVFNDEMRTRVVERLQLENDLLHAIQWRQLRLQYQPIVSLETGAIIGFEALLRWWHPEHGQIPTDEFLTIANETGSIVPIGKWVLKEACAQVKKWQQLFPAYHNLSVNINLAVSQLRRPDIILQVDQTLKETALEARHLILEITDGTIREDAQTANWFFKACEDRGIGVYLDDFGTDQSSLGNLHSLPITAVKIHQSFINGLDVDGRHVATVQAIQTLAQNRNLSVVIEGIETSQQLVQLQAIGCELAQGYYFSRPLNPEQAELLLTTGGLWAKSA